MDDGWHFWIDRGGTFTDVIARAPNGALSVHKLLSEHPERYSDAPLFAIRALLDIDADETIPPGTIARVKMGTTVATNALLERNGARTGLLVTKGFADLLAIGYQDRPEIFALQIQKPEALTHKIIEVDERVLADGTIRSPLNDDEVRRALDAFRAAGCDSIAVVFLHSYAFPDHERRAGELARESGFDAISLSHETAREIKAVGRGDTTVVDAYLTPLLQDYIDKVRNALGRDVALRFMQSHGGLTSAERFRGKNAVLSGPAGGVVACAHVSRLSGHNQIIGFDMGGTSTDVSRYDGRYERVYETKVAGVRLKAPMMAIETVAAGGGSILRYQQGRLTAGPDSAGANPGPAAYGKGGPPTVTDANAVLGRVQPDWFPNCFGPDARHPLSVNAAYRKLQELTKAVNADTGERRSVEEIAGGFLRIANENMAQAIKQVSVARGYDVQEYALCCFGGAAGQHACAIAESLGIRTILFHPFAGVLSAYGIGLADMAHDEVVPVLETVEGDGTEYESLFEDLESQGAALLEEEGFSAAARLYERSMDLRYEGADSFLNVPYDAGEDIRTAFETQHRALYGFIRRGHPIEAVNIRVESIGITDKPDEESVVLMENPVDDSLIADTVMTYFEWPRRGLVATPTPVYRRDDLHPGHWVDGPALIAEDVSTIVVEPRWQLRVDSHNHLEMTQQESAGRERVSTERDPIMLEVFNNLFMSIATQMGEMLERVSHSANIKERLDFSCALFSAEGHLVANAPHIPVHLGAMGESVRAVLDQCGPAMKPGDVYVTNDPYHGGSHLPDVTVVQPVFSGEDIEFFIANRAHHADIGGVTPGSMPPFSTTIEEEGVILHNFQLVDEGNFREREFVEALRMAKYPARNVRERLSDIGAQIAANMAGEQLLVRLCRQYGTQVVQAHMRHVRENAAEAMRACIRAMPDGRHYAEDALDDGATIRCTITVEGDRACVDFAGSSPQHSGNLNAPRAVVIAAVLYCFRTLIDEPIPLNAGCLDPIDIRIPDDSLLSPTYPAAVVGGNVETSMRIVDTVYKALGAVAGGQGTMNNFTFGTDDWGYYETICGGAGAGPGFDGADAVHTHMTNTRITDPEVLERRYPVVLRQFAVREASGGDGTNHGGDGVVREIEFLEECAAGLLTERRVTRPYGLNGAGDGAPGRNTLYRDRSETDLGGHARIDIQPGDRIRIETPGGGGFNPPEQR